MQSPDQHHKVKQLVQCLLALDTKLSESVLNSDMFQDKSVEVDMLESRRSNDGETLDTEVVAESDEGGCSLQRRRGSSVPRMTIRDTASTADIQPA
ncbi:unnamed protein product [Protopolystoma xenopodis]|uniref:Uncharacterized protein n=1 Tax=Protopolystoma xenopodis TaxID=117903 RepID=A0A3S5BLJ2_9PLAT|nr:unnamed protein product [Protopolystoma xenopodis]